MKTRIPLEGQGDVSAGVMSHQLTECGRRWPDIDTDTCMKVALV